MIIDVSFSKFISRWDFVLALNHARIIYGARFDYNTIIHIVIQRQITSTILVRDFMNIDTFEEDQK